MDRPAVVRTFRDLLVWQKGMQFVADVYRVTTGFPRAETLGLTAQLRRAAVSIPSNIAEGFARQSTIDFIRFLRISLGSLFEAQTQVELAERLGYLEHAGRGTLSSQGREIERMLTALIRSLSARKAFRRRTDNGTNR